MDWSLPLHQLEIPVVYWRLKAQFIIYLLIIDLMQVKRSKIVFLLIHVPSPFSLQSLCPYNLTLMCRVDRVTEAGGDVGRLNVVGGAEV
jgi:hypothetical protein